jgi:hypothetical protein
MGEALDSGLQRERARHQKLALVAIGLMPLMLGLAPWEFRTEMTPYRVLMGGYQLSLPLIQMFVIALALRDGMSPFALFAKMAFWQRVSLTVIGVILVVTSTAVALNPGVAIFRVYCWGIHLLFGLAIFHMFEGHSPDEQANAWKVLLLGCLGYVALLMVYIPTMTGAPDFDWIAMMPGMPNVRSLGFFSAVGASSALILAVRAQKSRAIFGWGLGGAVMIALAAWSGSRGAFIAIVGGVGVTAVLQKPLRSPRALTIYAAVIVFGCLLSILHRVPDPNFGLFHFWESSTRSDLNQISSNRLVLWRATLDFIPSHFWFGIGESQFKYTVPAAGGFNQPHNAILQYVLQWGVIGATCFFVLLASMVANAIQAVRSDGAHAASFAVMASLLIFSLYDAALYYGFPIMAVTLSLAMILTTRR